MFSLRIGERLFGGYQRPLVMGVINATPDSYYAPSRTENDSDRIARRTAMLLEGGADMLDLGAYSSRPGALDVTPDQEAERLERAIRIVRREVGPLVPLSVDTFRSSIAREAVTNWGADIINDISGGSLDSEMISTVASLQVPLVVMHMRGTPQTMGEYCQYPAGVVAEVGAELAASASRASLAGVADVIIDPGFGFSKTMEQNYELAAGLSTVKRLCDDRPLLVGVSRKSMLTKALDISAEEALPATCALHAFLLEGGADILRVHDAAEARQTIEIFMRLHH